MSFREIFKFIRKKANSICVSTIKNDNNKNNKTNFIETPNLETLIKDAIPSKHGLYPHEILMLYYAPNYKTTLENNYYQSFWCDKYYVANPSSILKSLFEGGFIETGKIGQTVEKLTIFDIKKILKSIKQKTNGSKQELIDRLLSNVPENILNEKYPERYFRLTDLGELELRDNYYVIYLHKTNFFNIWELNKLAPNTNNYRDVIWGYFNKQSLKELSNYNFGLYRNIRFNMGLFLLEEKKIKEALYFFCEVFKYDNCLLDNSSKYFLNEKDKKIFLISLNIEVNTFFSLRLNAPKLLEYFLYIQKELKSSEQDFQDLLFDNFNKIQVKFCMHTNEELVKIIEYEIRNESKKLKLLYDKAQKREIQKIISLKKELGYESLNLDEYTFETLLREKYCV